MYFTNKKVSESLLGYLPKLALIYLEI